MATVSALATYRQDNGLTLDAAAKMFGVDRTTVIRWEKGSPPIPIKRLEEISRLTGLPAHKLRPDLAGIMGATSEAA